MSKERKNILLVWDRLSEYHWARFHATKGLYNLGEVHVAELGRSDSLYFWKSVSVNENKHWYLSDDPVESNRAFARVFSFVRLVLDQKIDVVALPGYSHLSYILFLVVCRILGIRTIIFAESWYPGHRFLDLAKGWFLTVFTNHIFVSGIRARLHFNQRLSQSNNKITCGYSAVDNEHFSRDINVSTLPKRNIVLCIARYSPEKDLETLIQAYIKSNAYQKIELWLVGEGPQRDTLEHAVEGHEEWIKLKGWVTYSDLPSLYSRAICFVLPSKFEPWGLVVNEAMASGVPVICSDACGCIPDLDVEGSWIFESGSVENLIDVLNHSLIISENEKHSIIARQRKSVGELNPDSWAKAICRCAF